MKTLRRALVVVAALLALCIVVEAALVGTPATATGTSAPITTSPTITSTAGTLIVASAAAYNGGSSPQVANVSSNLAGTYTKAGDVAASSGTDRIGYGLTYNIGGTRTSGHTISVASSPATTQSKSGAFQEFTNIAASPTVTAGTTSTQALTSAPTCSVTVPSGTATVIGVMVYFGGSTTASVTDGTEISEVDESSTNQALFTAGKFGASGSTTITWALVAARNTSARCYAFEEAGGGPVTPGCKNGLLMLGAGCEDAR